MSDARQGAALALCDPIPSLWCLDGTGCSATLPLKRPLASHLTFLLRPAAAPKRKMAWATTQGCAVRVPSRSGNRTRGGSGAIPCDRLFSKKPAHMCTARHAHRNIAAPWTATLRAPRRIGKPPLIYPPGVPRRSHFHSLMPPSTVIPMMFVVLLHRDSALIPCMPPAIPTVQKDVQAPSNAVTRSAARQAAGRVPPSSRRLLHSALS